MVILYRFWGEHRFFTTLHFLPLIFQGKTFHDFMVISGCYCTPMKRVDLEISKCTINPPTITGMRNHVNNLKFQSPAMSGDGLVINGGPVTNKRTGE